MTQHQKNLAVVWTIAAVLVIALSIGGYAFFSDSNRGSGTGPGEPQVGSLEEIIAARKTWDVQFASWFGEPVGDLVVTDLEGREVKISDFRGKNAVVVFWATWCPACNMEIPHLIKLRDKYSEEELAIIAVSNESVEVLKPFSEAKNIDYTVARFGEGALPGPFDKVQGIPSSFFIDHEGRLKMAAVGLVPLEDSVGIIEHNRPVD